MALDTSVDENKWVLQRDGSKPEVAISAMAGATTIVDFQVTTQEWKYFAITLTAAQSYRVAHPELDLDIEVIQNMPTAANIIKRAEDRQITGISYA